jgi:hypothetical protein
MDGKTGIPFSFSIYKRSFWALCWEVWVRRDADQKDFFVQRFLFKHRALLCAMRLQSIVGLK